MKSRTRTAGRSLAAKNGKLDCREQTRWLVRSVSLPVQECLSMPWKDFMRVLHGAWKESTGLANWASHTLARNDCVRTPEMTQLPHLEKIDLYAMAFGRSKPGKPRREGAGPLPVVQAQYGGDAWEGAKLSAASLLRWVESKYRRERGKIVWRRERRTPEFLYPVPFPVSNQSWEVVFNENNQPVVYMALPGGRVSLRLRTGKEMARAIEVLKRIEAGELGKQEIKICRQRAFATHRRQGTERSAGGGNKVSYRVMVRISYRIEVPTEREGITAECRTGRNPFVALTIPGSHEWVLHAPWVKQWIVAHRKFLDEFSDDLKYEKRWPSRKRKNLNHRRERRCEKHARRMKSFLQQTAAQLIGHALRHNVGTLLYDDTDRSYADEFPWFELRQRLQQKCDETGVVFKPIKEVASDDASPDGKEEN